MNYTSYKNVFLNLKQVQREFKMYNFKTLTYNLNMNMSAQSLEFWAYIVATM